MTDTSDIRTIAQVRLEGAGIRPSVQRLRIMEYLLEHNTHPSVEEVHEALVGEIPTLSRTTVYNTLRMFADAGVARMVTIDEHRVCYDGMTADHGHFYCRRCGRIIDIPTAGGSGAAPSRPAAPLLACMAGREGAAPLLPGIGRVDTVEYYYKGVCATCAAAESKNR